MDSRMPEAHPAQQDYETFAKVLAFLTAVWALVVLVTRLGGLRFPASLGRHYTAMSPLAAGLMLALALALLAASGRAGRGPRWAAVLAGLATLVSLWVAAEYLLGPRLPPLPASWVQNGLLRTKVSALTAATTLGLAAAWTLVAAGLGHGRRTRQAGALLALCPLGICMVVLISYAAGVPLLYDRTPMTLPAAGMGIMLGLAVLFESGADAWPLALFGARTGRAPRHPLGWWWRSPLVAFLLVTAGIMAGGIFILRSQLKTARILVENELSAIGELKAGQVANWYRMRAGEIAQVHRSALIQVRFREFLAGRAGAEELKEWMATFLRPEGFARVVLFDAQGRTRLLVPGGQELVPSPAFSRLIHEALRLRHPEELDPRRQGGEGDPNLGLWVPVGIREAGAPAEGALLFQVDARPFLNRVVRPWPHSQPSAETLLAGRDQGELVILGERSGASSAAPAFSFTMTAPPGPGGVMDGTDQRGRRVVAAFKPVPGTPWVLITKVDEAEVYGPMRERIWNTALLLLGLITLVGMGIGLVRHRRDAERILGLLKLEREGKVLAERSDHLMRLANDMIMLTDLEGHILEANVAASEHFGYSAGEFRDMHLTDLRRPESTPQLLERFRNLKAAGSARFESLYLRKDGTEFPAEVSARVIEMGAESFVLHFLREITERKAAEAALRASEEKFSKAFATSPDAMNLNRLQDGVYIDINAGFTRMTGYRPEDVLGRSSRVGDCEIWADNADRERMVAELMEKGEVLGFEAPFRAKDGRRIIGRMSAVRLMIGSEECVLTTTRDITQMRASEQEHRQLEARLHQSQKLESLGSLAGGVAHDMNNVLGAILTLASSRRAGLDPADPMATALDTITTACKRGRGVVRSLLYFARKDLETTQPLDLNALVRDVVQLLGYTTLQRIRLEMELEEPLALVQGDSGALSHALMNLAVNALDAMPDQGTLRISTRSLPGGRVRLAVQDTGCGMAPDVLAKAVEPFYTTKPLGKGTGLGLAMVFGTMKAHGADLEINSRPGEGTEVLLTFPALEAVPASAEPSAEPAGAAGSLEILVVDDDELIRDSLVPMLEIMGHRAQSAPGGREAMARLQGGPGVDLVILDMNMPGMNGAETLARIKAFRPEQVVLMASGYNDSEVNQLAGSYAGISCIQKPFSMKELGKKLAGMSF